MRYGLKLPEWEPGVPYEFEREMGYSEEEFLKVALSLSSQAAHPHPRTVAIRNGGSLLEIEVLDAWRRELARMRVPVCRIRFRMTGMDQKEIDEWLARIERRFQRGGG